ncbi:unnamed protein product, partial [Leptidea sinapis]
MTKINNYCCGCLDAGSDLSLVNNAQLKKCFYLICNEKEDSKADVLQILLCYYCIGLLEKIKRFQEKVQTTQRLLKETDNNLNAHQKKPLQITEIYNISLEDKCKVQDEVPKIKSELINNSSNNNGSHTPEKITNNDSITNIVDEGSLKKKVETEDVILSSNSHKRNTLQISEVFNISITGNCNILYEVIPQIKSEPNDAGSVCSNDESDYKPDKVELEECDEDKVELFRKVKLKPADIEAERRRIMNSDDYVYAMFKCDKCIVPFSSKDDLDEHFKLKHKI